jgi:hypothetical protein
MFLLRLGRIVSLAPDGPSRPLQAGAGILPRALAAMHAAATLQYELGLRRPVEIARGDLLAFLRIEILEIGLGDLARSLGVDIGVDDGDRRLGQDRLRRHHRLEGVGAELLADEERLVLADIAFDLGFIAAILPVRPSPGGQTLSSLVSAKAKPNAPIWTAPASKPERSILERN